jgi:hypothetical protein
VAIGVRVAVAFWDADNDATTLGVGGGVTIPVVDSVASRVSLPLRQSVRVDVGSVVRLSVALRGGVPLKDGFALWVRVAAAVSVRLPADGENERIDGVNERDGIGVSERDPVLLLYVKCLCDHVILTVAVVTPQRLVSNTCPPNVLFGNTQLRGAV